MIVEEVRKHKLHVAMLARTMVRGFLCISVSTVAITIAMLSGVRLAQAESTPLTSTVCEVSKDPSRFDNKFVRLRATLAGNFEISAIRDPGHENCGSLWFTYPGSGPEASVSISSLTPNQARPAVQLQRDEAFRQFQKMVGAKMYPRRRGNICMDCSRYEVTATMTGLVEYAGPGKGFGHMNGFPVQFVLQSVQETSVKDLAGRYNAADFSTKPIRFPTGYISGTVRGPDGKPIEDADLTIYSAIDPEAHIEDDSATTDAQGHFRFAVPPGRYVIGFNTFWPPSAKFPYPPTYYPGTQHQDEATVVEVTDRQHKRDLIIQLPKPLVARTIPVKVVWPNGSPVDEASVWLSQTSDRTTIVGESVSHTAKDGTFNLIGFEGIDYILHADKYGGLARVSCAKNLLLRASKPISSCITIELSRTDFDACSLEFEDASEESEAR
jgi:hypothetical protein